MRLKKLILILLGTLSLLAGILGIIIPGIPATPFLLLSAWLYLKGSRRLYFHLMKNRFLGPYIEDYRRKKGMPLKTKIYAIAMVWFMVGISAGVFIDSLPVRIAVILLGFTGTLVMGFIVPTWKDK